LALLRTYALSPEALRGYLRRTFWRFQIIVTLSFLLFGLYLALFARPIRWVIVIPMLVVIALAYFFIIFLNYRHQMRVLYSVRIELDGSGVIYNQFGQEPLRISRADITQARERNDGLFIETVDPRLKMLIPNGLARDGDQAVRQDVAAWVKIKPNEASAREGLFWARMGAYGAAFMILLFVNQFWLAALLGLALFAYGSYTQARLNRVHFDSPGTVRFYSSALTFIIFIILMKSCLLGLLWVMGW